MAPTVNRPTVVAQRDKSVSEKMQLFGIYSAFAQGKMPTNQQIDVALNSALESKALSHPSSRLSEEGRKLVADLSEVITQAKYLLLSKNDGQLLQEFIWSTETAGRNFTAERKAPEREKSAPFVAKDQATADSEKAVAGLKTLGKLLVTNGQFRKLLKDASILARSMVGDVATKTAGRVNPSQEQLDQIDEPAPENSWHEMKDYGEGGFAGHLKSQYGKRAPWGKKKAAAAAAAATATATATSTAAKPAGTPGVVDNETMVSADDTATVSSSMSRSEKWRGQAKSYWNEKMPEQRRDNTIHRLKMMITEIQGHAEYQSAIVTLLDLLDSYSDRAGAYSKNGASKTGSAFTTPDARSAQQRLKTLVERFANSTSLDDLFDAVAEVQKQARADPELRSWFRGVQAYLRRCLQEVGFVTRDESTREYRELYDHGQKLARGKYRTEFNHILHEIESFGKQFDADPQNKAFGKSIERLCLDLGQDAEGKPKFKPHLVQDIVSVVAPAFLQNLSYVPIPRMEYRDDMLDLIVENLIVEGDNLTPNVLELKSDNHWRWGRQKIGSNNKNSMMLAVSGIQMDLRDVSYHVRKKTGFPKVSDTGIMDIFLGGRGLSMLIEMETADRFLNRALVGGAHFFRAKDVQVKLEDFNIKVKKSTHKFLIALAKPILLRLLKPVIAKVAAAQVKKKVAELDSIAYQISQEVDRGRLADKRLPIAERVKQPTYRRYMSVLKARLAADKQRKKEEAERKVRAAGGKKPGQFKFVMTEEQSLFPEVRLPPGVTAKATEYRDLAKEGTGWESPVFAVGRAPASSKIPPVEKITRKSTWAKKLAASADTAGAGGAAAAGAAGAAGFAHRQQQHHNHPSSLSHQVPGIPEDSTTLPMDSLTYERAINPDTYRHGGAGTGGAAGAADGAFPPSAIDTKASNAHRYSNNSSMVDTPMYPASAGLDKSGLHHQARAVAPSTATALPPTGIPQPQGVAGYQPSGLAGAGAGAGAGALNAGQNQNRQIPGGFPPSVPQTPEFGELPVSSPFQSGSNGVKATGNHPLVGNVASHIVNPASSTGGVGTGIGSGLSSAPATGAHAVDRIDGSLRNPTASGRDGIAQVAQGYDTVRR